MLPRRIRPYARIGKCDHLLPSPAALRGPCDHISQWRRHGRRRCDHISFSTSASLQSAQSSRLASPTRSSASPLTRSVRSSFAAGRPCRWTRFPSKRELSMRSLTGSVPPPADDQVSDKASEWRGVTTFPQGADTNVGAETTSNFRLTHCKDERLIAFAAFC